MKTFVLIIALALLLPVLAYSQLPNEGFEEWQAQGERQLPVGWSFGPVGAGRIDSSYSGKFAASVWNWYISSLGYLVAGESLPPFGSELKHVGIPISFLPTRLTGYYKYELGENRFAGDEEKIDSAAVYVLVKRYNPESGEIDTISFVPYLLPPSGKWIPFSVDLPQRLTGLQPDSIVVIFYSSNPLAPASCGPESGDCCYLSVDNVVLQAPSGIRYDLNSPPAPTRIFPNPAVGGATSLQFDGEEGKSYGVKVYDALGRLVVEHTIVGPHADLSDLGLASGAYHLWVVDASGRSVAAGRFVVE